MERTECELMLLFFGPSRSSKITKKSHKLFKDLRPVGYLLASSAVLFRKPALLTLDFFMSVLNYDNKFGLLHYPFGAGIFF